MDDPQLDVRYTGAELGSRNRVYRQVLIWDEEETEGRWRDWASFELGLLQPADWQEKWIDPEPNSIDSDARYPASVLTRTFTIEACRFHGNPNQSIGRPMKVGKQELMGALEAIYLNPMTLQPGEADDVLDRLLEEIGKSNPRCN